MNEKIEPLKIYGFSHPLEATEFLSVRGDKYVSALPFPIEFVSVYDEAQVVAWDGVLTPKNSAAAERIITDCRSTKVLLLVGESRTLFKEHPLARLLEVEGLRTVDLPGWNVLPEEVLAALEECQKKSKDV